MQTNKPTKDSQSTPRKTIRQWLRFLFKCHAAVKYRRSVLLLILSEVSGSHRDCAAAGHVLPSCFDFVVL